MAATTFHGFRRWLETSHLEDILAKREALEDELERAPAQELRSAGARLMRAIDAELTVRRDTECLRA